MSQAGLPCWVSTSILHFVIPNVVRNQYAGMIVGIKSAVPCTAGKEGTLPLTIMLHPLIPHLVRHTKCSVGECDQLGLPSLFCIKMWVITDEDSLACRTESSFTDLAFQQPLFTSRNNNVYLRVFVFSLVCL